MTAVSMFKWVLMADLHEIPAFEMREIQTEILTSVSDFCRDREIRFYLWAGTLLGAVRHRGYIPWDDDIDLAMPRDDYERFCREFPSERAEGNLSLRTMETDPAYGFPYAKVADSRTRILGASPLADPIGINIDIFPIDGWPDGWLATRLHRLRMTWHHRVAAVWTQAHNPTRPTMKTVVMTLLRPAVRLVHIRLLIGRLSNVARSVRFEDRRFVGVTVFSYLERVESDVYGDAVDVEFEGRLFPAPRRFDRLLQSLYGDYMKLPPEDERRTGWHASGAYWLESADGR